MDKAQPDKVDRSRYLARNNYAFQIFFIFFVQVTTMKSDNSVEELQAIPAEDLKTISVEDLKTIPIEDLKTIP
ncbi:hypothetical protein CI610_02938 [invertebrate metagenome]|uniref:Uncharacterized protein n=1 Tax=invertebrate metagenome TaxID=1711999 RepID=A0A2H9T4J4_9ZZZZ